MKRIGIRSAQRQISSIHLTWSNREEGSTRWGGRGRGGEYRGRWGLEGARETRAGWGGSGKAGGPGGGSGAQGTAAWQPEAQQGTVGWRGDSPQQPCYVNSEGWRSRNYSLARPAAAGSAPRCSATTRTRPLDAGWPWPTAPGPLAPGPLSASLPGPRP